MPVASTCVQEELFALADPNYREFHSRLMPAVDARLVIGVRTPALRTLAKRLADDPLAPEFLEQLPHRYYEENNLHGELINLAFGRKGSPKATALWPRLARHPEWDELDQAYSVLDEFLPHVDNWATCDLLAPKVLARHPERTLDKIEHGWMCAGHTYTVRFGITTLMRHYLDERFNPAQLDWVVRIPAGEYYIDMARAWYLHTYTVRFGITTLMRHYLDERFNPAQLDWVVRIPAGEYYIDMARAWYLSFALIKQYDATVGLFERRVLDPWTHNKALQKARESYRVDEETKRHLQGLKVKA